MASLRTSSALVAACLLMFVLASCGASRPIGLPLHESEVADNSVFTDAIPRVDVTTAVDITSQPAFELPAHVTSRALVERDCRTSDIIIKQFEVSGVGFPTFQVEISNTCTNPLCSMSSVITHCGSFHSGDILVNPKVFRRLNQLQGTCIVNDGQQIRNADTIIFQYKEIWEQPITFLSARVICHG